jgi:glycosyltransferase involved in cell wall biosynthesis
MWAFMGAEHYDDVLNPGRYIKGYFNVDKNLNGLDLNRFMWQQKLKYWKDFNFHIIGPSTWMAKCSEESYLLKNNSTSVIPNIINEKIYKVQNKIDLRKKLNLPVNKKLILFGAFNAKSFNKGGDLLQDAIQILDRENTEILIFGASTGPQFGKFKTHYLGFINDEELLSQYYSIADVMIVPSRIENFPNTILESINCGTPVVAFNIGGIPDMINHKGNGYLAKAFDIADLNQGINWILDNSENRNFAKECQEIVEEKFKTENSLRMLIDLYKKTITQHKKVS